MNELRQLCLGRQGLSTGGKQTIAAGHTTPQNGNPSKVTNPFQTPLTTDHHSQNTYSTYYDQYEFVNGHVFERCHNVQARVAAIKPTSVMSAEEAYPCVTMQMHIGAWASFCIVHTTNTIRRESHF